jgi:hypothetical protein
MEQPVFKNGQVNGLRSHTLGDNHRVDYPPPAPAVRLLSDERQDYKLRSDQCACRRADDYIEAIPLSEFRHAVSLRQLDQI